MSFPPTAFLIGAQKAGSTTLATLLEQHPNVVLSNPKEPDFFASNWDRGVPWYQRCFSGTDGVLVDASVSYSMARIQEWEIKREHDVPRRIYEMNPEAKFIYIVRDPAERCHSAYWHEVRARDEQRSLREAVRQRAYFTMGGYYYLQLSRYLPFFPLDRFLIFRFEDFVAAPGVFAQKCITFLGAGMDDYTFVVERARNQGFRYTGFGGQLRHIVGQSAFDRITSTANRILPASLRQIGRALVSRDLPPLTGDEREWIYAQYAQDEADFEALTGVRVRRHAISKPAPKELRRDGRPEACGSTVGAKR